MKRLVAAATIAFACGHAVTRGPTPSADTLLVITPAGDAWSLAFTIENRGASAVTATYMYPFTSFQLAVTDARGAALQVAQPALDIPVEPRELVIAAHATAMLTTPIRVRFLEQAPPSGGDDVFVWTIRAPSQPVTLIATFELPGLGVRTAIARLTP